MTTTTNFRQRIFQHLDGLVTAPVVYSLFQKGILQYLLEHKEVSLSQLTSEFKANEGYLNIALRVLASQGMLEYSLDNTTNTVVVKTNSKSALSFSLAPVYEEVVDVLKEKDWFTSVQIQPESYHDLNMLFEWYKNNCHIQLSEIEEERAIQEQFLAHIEGYLAAPIIVSLGMTGMFHKYFMETSFSPEEFHKHPEVFKIILDFFTHLGWFTRKNNNYQFTELG